MIVRTMALSSKTIFHIERLSLYYAHILHIHVLLLKVWNISFSLLFLVPLRDRIYYMLFSRICNALL